jgi:hypothetical protein
LKRAALAALLVAAVVVGLVFARRDGDEHAAQFENSCAASGVEVPKPPPLASFPLPAGTRLTVASTSAAGAVLASGYVPLSFPEAVQYFRTHYRSSGVGEAEGAGSAGARFHRNGRSGSWKVDELTGCSTASLLTLRLKP